MKKESDTHESYGLLQLSRITCSPPMNVFGSAVKTSNPISLRIYRAEKQRELSREWYFSKKRLIEVYMSPSQFAEAVTTMNYGSGVPVTIQEVTGTRMQECPVLGQHEAFNKELKNEISKVLNKLDIMEKRAEELCTKKGALKVDEKKELLHIEPSLDALSSKDLLDPTG